MLIVRDDLSDRLVHLTKGPQAFENFVNILNTRTILGGTGYIKGNYRCVCFSEAPISKLPQILAMPHETVKYRPYGFIFHKNWVFSAGGRPVIYQPDPDFAKLPEEKRHLHVRFWLSDKYSVDHTWEREWRIKTDALKFTPAEVTVLVPTRDISDRIKQAWVLDDQEDAYPWHHVVLEDLGVQMSDYLD